MKTIEELKNALEKDRAGFIKGLIAAGYVDMVVYNNTGSDDELVRMAIQMYNDTDNAFDIFEFESWLTPIRGTGVERTPFPERG